MFTLGFVERTQLNVCIVMNHLLVVDNFFKNFFDTNYIHTHTFIHIQIWVNLIITIVTLIIATRVTGAKLHWSLLPPLQASF